MGGTRGGPGAAAMAASALLASVLTVATLTMLGGTASAMQMSRSGMQQMEEASAAAAKAPPKQGSTITIHNFSFLPGSIKVKPGQKVRVTNKDQVIHTVTSTTGKFNTGDVHPGQTVTFTAPKKAGKYPYRCNIHQYMTGVLVVS